jgi:hypothetical protein
MGYIKLIESGHVIEVYNYEFPPNLDKQLKANDKYNPLDLDYLEHLSGSNIVADAYTRYRNKRFHEERERLKNLKGDRKGERRVQTMRDARNNIRRLALMNFSERDAFITLTYAENMQDIRRADEHFREFIEAINHDFDKNHKYIAVREFQKRGAIHFHMLIDLHIDYSDKEERQYIERELHKYIWKHGFVNYQLLDREHKMRKKSVDNVGAYLVKYMDKDFDDERLQGHKLYLCSQGLERPKVLKGLEAIERMKELGLEDKKIVFDQSYPTEYLGNCIYKEYNLKRT